MATANSNKPIPAFVQTRLTEQGERSLAGITPQPTRAKPSARKENSRATDISRAEAAVKRAMAALEKEKVAREELDELQIKLEGIRSKLEAELKAQESGELDLREGQFIYISNASGPDMDGIKWVRIQRRKVLRISPATVRLGVFEEARWPAGTTPTEPLKWEKLYGYYGIPCTMPIRRLQRMPVSTSYNLEGMK